MLTHTIAHFGIYKIPIVRSGITCGSGAFKQNTFPLHMLQTQTSNYMETSKLTLEHSLGTRSQLPASVDPAWRYACTPNPSIKFEKALCVEKVSCMDKDKRGFD